MITVISLLVAASLSVPASWAAEPVEVVWKVSAYSGPQFRGYECAQAEAALRDFFGRLEARQVRSVCSRYGLSASWETLSPAGKDPAVNVARFLRRHGFELSSEGDEALQAVWVKGGFRRQMAGGGRLCQIQADLIGYLVGALPLRNVSYDFSCSGGGGMITVSFERLQTKKISLGWKPIKRR